MYYAHAALRYEKEIPGSSPRNTLKISYSYVIQKDEIIFSKVSSVVHDEDTLILQLLSQSL
jgi:hypothetical protein